jgi:hypothetical protein
MSEEVKQQDLDLFYSKTDAALSATQRLMREELELLEKKLDSLEQISATMMVGYAEQAVYIEALMAQLEYETKERQDAFKAKVQDLRKVMMETLEYTADVMESGDPSVIGTMEDVVVED